VRNAKGLLSIVAGLVLLFQAGTTAVYADDGVNGNVGAQAQAALETSIKNAEKAAAQLATAIAGAQLSLHSGTLNVTQELALNATAQAAMSAQKELAAALAAAQNAVTTLLRNPINAGNAAEIAAAAEAAHQAAANLNAAANTATQANANLNTTTNAIGTTQTGSQSTTTSQMVVGGVQTLPSTSTGDNIPLTALGVVLLSIGVWMLRKPHETSAD
jgi:LPXTG-motif cell wall-anchored protein